MIKKFQEFVNEATYSVIRVPSKGGKDTIEDSGLSDKEAKALVQKLLHDTPGVETAMIKTDEEAKKYIASLTHDASKNAEY